MTEAEAKFGLQRHSDQQFFQEWGDGLPALTETELADLDVMYRRLAYHRSESELLEGAVTLLVASPLLKIAGFYDPPFKMRSETAIELMIDDGEEILRGGLIC